MKTSLGCPAAAVTIRIKIIIPSTNIAEKRRHRKCLQLSLGTTQKVFEFCFRFGFIFRTVSEKRNPAIGMIK